MEPRIIYKPAFTVIGISANGDGANKMDALWQELGARYVEIPQADPDAGFGVHTWSPAGRHYLAGLALGGGAASIPEGMTVLKIEAHAYAVFTHTGLLSRMPEMVGSIFGSWLPGSAYQAAADFYFEYYDDRFTPGSRDSVVFVWVPVMPRG